MIFLGYDFMDFMLLQYSMPKWSLNGANLDRWGVPVVCSGQGLV